MKSIVHECPEAIHKTSDEVKAQVLEQLFGTKPQEMPEFRSGMTLNPAGTRDHAGYKNRLDGNGLDHTGYHEVHLRPKQWHDNSRLRRMPFKVSV